MKMDKFHGKLSSAILVQCSLCHYIVVHFFSYKFLDKGKNKLGEVVDGDDDEQAIGDGSWSSRPWARPDASVDDDGAGEDPRREDGVDHPRRPQRLRHPLHRHRHHHRRHEHAGDDHRRRLRPRPLRRRRKKQKKRGIIK